MKSLKEAVFENFDVIEKRPDGGASPGDGAITHHQVIDFFVSHSWSDNLDFKWPALEKLAADFLLVHGRYPTFWLDKESRAIGQDQSAGWCVFAQLVSKLHHAEQLA